MLIPLLPKLQFMGLAQPLPTVDHSFLVISLLHIILVKCSIHISFPNLKGVFYPHQSSCTLDCPFLFSHPSIQKWITANPEYFVGNKGPVSTCWPQNVILACGSEPFPMGLKPGSKRGTEYSCPKGVKFQSLCTGYPSLVHPLHSPALGSFFRALFKHHLI